MNTIDDKQFGAGSSNLGHIFLTERGMLTILVKNANIYTKGRSKQLELFS